MGDQRLESSITGLDIKLDEKIEMIQEWFVHMSSQTPTDVPAEVVNSLQEVIAVGSGCKQLYAVCSI